MLIMQYKYFTLAVALGMLSLPLACSDSDDLTPASGGTGGVAGQAATGGKGGAVGSAGKNGSAGSGLSNPGAAGEGGSGNTGNVGGDLSAGMGGVPDLGGAPGAGGDAIAGANAGGEAGQGSDPVAARLAKCETICRYPAVPDGPGGSKPPMECLGDASMCATALCDTTGWTPACVQTLDDLLACLPIADPTLFYCSGNEGTADSLQGVLSVDFAAFVTCQAVSDAWTACLKH